MAVELYHEDCLDAMQGFPDHSFDAIIADLPYGTTACKWDSVIPFKPLWKQYKRLAKKRAAIVLFGSQPFTSALVMSNVEWFKYCWVWDKVSGGSFVHVKHRPLQTSEDLCVFGDGTIKYNPIMTNAKTENIRPPNNGSSKGSIAPMASGTAKSADDYDCSKRYPKTIITFSRYAAECNSLNRVHPTQKPVALLEYLIRTYTNEGDTILDNTMGSGTTMVACVNTGRNGVGIELYPLPGQPIHKTDNPDYFGIAKLRIEKAQNEMLQLALV